MQLTEKDIRTIRDVFRLSQAELGAMINVSDAYINQIERKKRNVSNRVRESIVYEFALTPEKLARIYEIYKETTV